MENNLNHTAPNTGTELAGWPLLAARALWVLVAVVVTGLNVIATPLAYQTALQPCPADGRWDCNITGQLTPAQVSSLQKAGQAMDLWAAYQVGLGLVAVTVFIVVGLVIFWRRSNDPMALFSSLMLISFSAAGIGGTIQVLPFVSSAWTPVVNALNAVGQCSFMTFLFIFPNGRFVPGWTRFVAVAWTALWVGRAFGPTAPLCAAILDSSLFIILFLPIPVFAQIYRYRRVSDARQRQQTKWVVYGVGVGLLAFSAMLIVGNFVLPGEILNSWGGQLLGNIVLNLCLTAIPTSIGIAILHSRLYEIDVVINRTLVYGALTGTLALTYWAAIAGLQVVLRPIAGEGNDLAVVMSTLLIAALFLPLRRRIQAFIDRRFFRSKYDVTRTLAAFGQVARDEVDLDALASRLVGVVDETMQPAHVSLWLRREHEM